MDLIRNCKMHYTTYLMKTQDFCQVDFLYFGEDSIDYSIFKNVPKHKFLKSRIKKFWDILYLRCCTLFLLCFFFLFVSVSVLCLVVVR